MLNRINKLTVIAIIMAIIHSCAATLDTSNLDLDSFRFFRYINRLPNGDFTYAPAPPPSLQDHLNRAKAGVIIVISLFFLPIIFVMLFFFLFSRYILQWQFMHAMWS